MDKKEQAFGGRVATMISIGAVVTRCGCAGALWPHPEGCPTPRAVEDRGTISYWHKNPLRRLLWRLKEWSKR